MNATITTLID
jgi:hypothetical protein